MGSFHFKTLHVITLGVKQYCGPHVTYVYRQTQIFTDVGVTYTVAYTVTEG